MAKDILKSARWARVRARQLAREPMCRMCTELGNDRLAIDVDHVVPRSRGGAPFDAQNLQSLCKEHHSFKTNNYDRAGKDWSEYVLRGCGPDGYPLDPAHPFHPEASTTDVCQVIHGEPARQGRRGYRERHLISKKMV